MIKINLLPPEYAEAQSKKEKQILAGSAGTILIVVFLGFWAIKNSYANKLDDNIREAEAELKNFQAIVAQIESIEKNKKSLKAKRDVIKNLNQSRLIYPVFFEDLLPIIPSNVWIKSIKINVSGNAFKITMNSSALSNFALATWLTNFEQSRHFSNVDIGSISYEKRDEGPPILNFSLDCSYRHQGAMPLEEYY